MSVSALTKTGDKAHVHEKLQASGTDDYKFMTGSCEILYKVDCGTMPPTRTASLVSASQLQATLLRHCPLNGGRTKAVVPTVEGG